jgi:hypothetical protein
MAIPSTVTVTGVLAPTFSGDTYPVMDSLYGLDGLRNVTSTTERNAIPNDRRRVGMLVGVMTGSTSDYWRLLASPWTGTDSDWTLFNSGNDIFVSGMTFNNATYDLTVTRNDGSGFTQNLGILASDVTVTGGTYDKNTGIVTFSSNTVNSSIGLYYAGNWSALSAYTGGTVVTYTANNLDYYVISTSVGPSATPPSGNTSNWRPISERGIFTVSGFTSGYTDTYVTGGTLSNGTLTLTKSDGTNASPITGFTGLISVTKSQADTLIAGNSLSTGSFYQIFGVDPTLYNNDSTSGTTIILQATSTNKFSLEGIGLFYNPKYNQSLTEYGIWNNLNTFTTSSIVGTFSAGESIIADNGSTGTLFATIDSNKFISSAVTWLTATAITGLTSSAKANISGITVKTYNVGNTAIWGGKLWTNITGNIGTSLNSLSLNTDWSAVTYNTTDYNLVADAIQYDYDNDTITKRADAYGNVVVSTKSDATEFTSRSLTGKPISVFQWGNPYNYSTAKGTGYNQIINGYAECINVIGAFYGNIIDTRSILNNNTLYTSRIFNNRLSDGTLMNTNILYGSQIYSNSLSKNNPNPATTTNINNNILTNSYITSNTLILGSTINFNTLTNGSYISSNLLYNRSNINSNSVLNNSNIYYNDLAYSSLINTNTLSLNSLIYYNVLKDSSQISSNSLSGTSNAYIYGNTISTVSQINGNIVNNFGRIRGNKLLFSSTINSNNLVDTTIAINYIYNNTLNLGVINSNTLSGTIGGAFTNYGINNNQLLGNYYSNATLPTGVRSAISNCGVYNGYINSTILTASELLYASLSGVSVSDLYRIHNNTFKDVSLNYNGISITKNLEYSDLNTNTMLYKTSITFTGGTGAGQIGSLTLPPFLVPTNYFIDEVIIDVGTGLTASSGGASIINLGISTDATNSGLNDITGLISTLNTNTITRIFPSIFTKATALRTIVGQVKTADITAGTANIRVKLSKLS